MDKNMAEIIFFFGCAVIVFAAGVTVFAYMYKEEYKDDNDR